ncbi:EamA family transporter [Streptomyces sp. URMC 123]|uniref:EamA family transporter n=1 Tax=Streptomyces sp. URMC 123 TaxID=3423403 RepID=UPI003F1CC36E
MRPAHIALAVLVTAVWGVNFVVIDVGLDRFPPLLFAALRFLVAAVPAVFLVRRPTVGRRWIIGVGAALGVGKFGMLFVGMHLGMPAGLASLVLQAQAVFTVLIAAAVLGERPRPVRVVGIALAFAGVTVAAVDEGASGPLLGFALVVLAAAMWGVSNVLTRKAAPDDALGFMVWVCLVPVLPLSLLSLLIEGPEADLAALRGIDWSGAGAILFVAWVSTVFCFAVWSSLLRRYDASAVAPFSLLVPVFGMSSAALFLGESVSAWRWVAAVLLVGGVAVTSFRPAAGGKRAADGVSAAGSKPVIGSQPAAGVTTATGADGHGRAPGAAAVPTPAGTSASRTPSTATPGAARGATPGGPAGPAGPPRPVPPVGPVRLR